VRTSYLIRRQWLAEIQRRVEGIPFQKRNDTIQVGPFIVSVHHLGIFRGGETWCISVETTETDNSNKAYDFYGNFYHRGRDNPFFLNLM
jgi:hypothetical protein